MFFCFVPFGGFRFARHSPPDDLAAQFSKVALNKRCNSSCILKSVILFIMCNTINNQQIFYSLSFPNIDSFCSILCFDIILIFAIFRRSYNFITSSILPHYFTYKDFIKRRKLIFQIRIFTSSLHCLTLVTGILDTFPLPSICFSL